MPMLPKTHDDANAPQALLFDLDGTLVDNMAWHGKAWEAFFAERGKVTDPREFALQTAGRKNDEILCERLGPALSAGELRDLAARKEALYQTLYRPHLRAVRGAEELLATARRRGLKTALATSAPSENVRFVLEATGLAPMFDAIVCADDGLPGKPSPDLFLEAARRVSVPAPRAVVFEDALLGIEAAQRAGMPVVVLLTTLRRDELRGEPGIVAAIADFAALDGERLFAGTLSFEAT